MGSTNGGTLVVICSAKVDNQTVEIWETFTFDDKHKLKSAEVDCNRMDIIAAYRKKEAIEKEPYSVFPVNLSMTWIICGVLGVIVLIGLSAAKPKQPQGGNEP